MVGCKRTLVAKGKNRLLGELLCYSCQEHNRCSNDDKFFEIEQTFYVSIFKNGSYEVFANQENNPEKQDALINEINAITERALENFYNGVCVSIGTRKMECSSCGSQEFVKPE